MPRADHLQDLRFSPTSRTSWRSLRCVHHRLLIGIFSLPLAFEEHQLYPKTSTQRVRSTPTTGRVPSHNGDRHAVPGELAYAGYVTTYLTPLSQYLADHTHHLGTTIVAHRAGSSMRSSTTPGARYVVETSILFTAFAIASYLYRRREEE